MRIGIVTGLAFEASIVSELAAKLAWGADAPEVKCAGMGGADAHRIVTEMVSAGIVGVVSFGVAGGLSPELRPCTLVVPDRVLSGDGQIFPTDAQWRTSLLTCVEGELAAVSAPILSSVGLLSEVSAKHVAWRDSGAVAADMESARIASAARSADVKFLAVRAVADDAATKLPPATRAVNAGGGLDVGRFVGSLMVHPGQIPDLFRLGLNTRRARRALRTTCRLGGPGLGAF